MLEGTAQCLIDANLSAKNQLEQIELWIPLPAPRHVCTAVATVPVAMQVPSLIIRTDCLRPRRDGVTHKREIPGSLYNVRAKTLLFPSLIVAANSIRNVMVNLHHHKRHYPE